MNVVCDPAQLQRQCLAARREGRSIALVPTMGYLHAGHAALLDDARHRAEVLVASVFVNPVQFGPAEDLATYPRSFEADAALARDHGVDLLFAPDPEVMYAPDHDTWVEVPGLARGLCGASRPGHFRGVCTVVSKLLLLAQPDVAVFGQKDYQQLAVLRRMVRDLNFPVQVQGHPIIREPDGLALSSRNVYLSADERAQAPAIYAGLRLCQRLVREGQGSVGQVLAAFQEHLAVHAPLTQVEYDVIAHPESLEPLGDSARLAGAMHMLVAVRLGRTRLIDNLRLQD